MERREPVEAGRLLGEEVDEGRPEIDGDAGEEDVGVEAVARVDRQVAAVGQGRDLDDADEEELEAAAARPLADRVVEPVLEGAARVTAFAERLVDEVGGQVGGQHERDAGHLCRS